MLVNNVKLVELLNSRAVDLGQPADCPDFSVFLIQKADWLRAQFMTCAFVGPNRESDTNAIASVVRDNPCPTLSHRAPPLPSGSTGAVEVPGTRGHPLRPDAAGQTHVLSPAISKENRRLSSAACAQSGSTPTVVSAAVTPTTKAREARDGLCSVSRAATVRTRAAAASADIVSPE
jgi:hypothetical protein